MVRQSMLFYALGTRRQWFTQIALSIVICLFGIGVVAFALGEPETVLPTSQSVTTEVGPQHTITFVANGGSAVSPLQVSSNLLVALSDNATARDGYQFTGWFLDAALTQPVTTVCPQQDMTLYAGWEQ